MVDIEVPNCTAAMAVCRHEFMIAFAPTLQQTGTARGTSTRSNVSIFDLDNLHGSELTSAGRVEAMIALGYRLGMLQEASQQVCDDIFILLDELILLELAERSFETCSHVTQVCGLVQEQLWPCDQTTVFVLRT
jgi:hypothetical protein